MIPSLLQIPSAVSDSKLHSVLPNNGKGDFTFDRSTGATRINKDGLIEEVGYFSSELVQNGNFSELGNEEISNGDFSQSGTLTSTSWTLGWQSADTGASISNGILILARTTSSLRAYATNNVNGFISLTSGKTYKLTYTIISNNNNANFDYHNGSSYVSAPNTVGTHTIYYTAAGTIFLFRINTNNSTIELDNVSVKQVDPNDRWTLGTGWGYGDGVVSSDGSQSGNSDCTQNLLTPTGKTYKITYTISQYSAGSVFIRLASGNVTTTQTSAGTFTEILNGAGGTQVKIRANSTFVGTISNISIVEVQGDRPRLSYDITNGVVESQPHLLLEPSATNLIEYSQDFTTRGGLWQLFGNLTKELNTVISPEGIRNAATIKGLDGAGNNDFRYAFSFNTANKSVTYSVYLKGSGTLRLQVSNGVDQAFNNIITLSDEWQRFSVSGTFNSTSVSTVYLVIDDYISLTATEYDVWGAQFEEQSYATSYIPTAGTIISRSSETCNNSKPSVNSTEGVLYAEIAALADDLTFRSISINNGTSDEAVIVRFRTTSNRINGLIRDGGSAVNNLNFDVTDIKDFHKVAYKFKTGDCALYVDGTEVATGTASFTLSTQTTLNFDNGVGDFFYGKVKGLAVYNEALTDAQLIELTS